MKLFVIIGILFLTVRDIESSGAVWSAYNHKFKWEGHVFALPHNRSSSPLSKLCSQFSTRFCMTGYYVEGKKYEREMDESDEFVFYSMLNGLYKELNWFSFSIDVPEERGKCCTDQLKIYSKYGIRKGLTPLVFLAKSLNFSSNGRQLNLIKAKYNKNLCVNVVTTVGFGLGRLQMDITHNADFLLTPNTKGVLHFFSYRELRDYLTFDWFKYNFICDEQNWVCEDYPPKIVEYID
ncbi:uncharacterized protein LOC142348209 isoform X1 [Convolutriloba macropyga]|uniref:uncharacterized protein LOC142348209 isoform X1 n=1 Tax=Convolutriloba macropyga TaxID=536237 RepID=UPI003F523269